MRGPRSIGWSATTRRSAAFRRGRAATPELRQPSLFNLGNALVRAAEERPGEAAPLLDAVGAYEEALRLDPADAGTRKWNLEVALRRLGDDRTGGGSSGRGRNADYGRGNMNVPGYEGNPDAAVGAMAGGGYRLGRGRIGRGARRSTRRAVCSRRCSGSSLPAHEGRREQPRADTATAIGDHVRLLRPRSEML